MIWKSNRSNDKKRRVTDILKRRAHAPERLESRQMMAADPIHIGVVYLETDYLSTDQDSGGDSAGDRFILSFTGGAPETELKELRIITDKDRDGLGVGDLIFDTAAGGRGKDEAHPFQVARIETADGRQANVTSQVTDGGQELVLTFTNFRAGDRLEFTMDVDEVLRLSSDLNIFNSRLDVIASGQEFQDSILEATFSAPHYELADVDSIFLNDYGTPSTEFGLNLPPDKSGDPDSRPNRSAAAVSSTVQVPKPVEISGHVWVDNNLNRVREVNEALLAGVAISLQRRDASGRYVSTGFQTTTDATGLYQFPKSLGLTPGVYRVVETQPTGFLSVAAVPGTVGSNSTGRAESLDVLTDIEILFGDTSAINYDFAEALPASISGHVYRDDNDNAIRDAGEVGLSGIRVQLVPVETIAPQMSNVAIVATTDANGAYQFTGLAPGRYELYELDQPADLEDGRDQAGTVDGKRIGVADEPGDAIRQIVLAGGANGIHYDFGELPLSSLAGFVYLLAPGEDCDGNHHAPGNTPLPGVRVVLESEAGQFVAETVTDGTGAYFFDALPKGTYQIREFTPSGLLDGDSSPGRIRNVVVGQSIDGGFIQSIELSAGSIGTEYNFCEASPARISGYVYHDASNDGVRGSDEEGIPGATLVLVDASGKVVATTTSINGYYEFDNVLPGEYTIHETQPTGFIDGIDTPGTIRGTRVGQLGSGGDSIVAIQVKQGDVGVEYNFGELLSASLSGRVHVDLDDDCIMDANEQPLAGVKIEIFDKSGKLVATTTTDNDGRYKFDNLAPGEYTVVETQPEGFFEGGATVGSAGGVTSGPNRIGTIQLASAEVAVDYDFCERPPAEISGFVFSDRDGDCEFDMDEAPISGVLVELYDDAGKLVATANTDANGRYLFSNLMAGSYMVREIQPVGWIQGGQKAGSAGGDDSKQDVISRIPIAWGERLTQYNFCELEPSSISGVVYVDLDADCERDEDEPPLAGVVIQLRDASGRVIETTQTDASGRYTFGGLAPGDYQVFEQQPDGFYQGGQTVGSGGGRVLGDDLLGVAIPAGQNLVDYDFCELPPSSISGVVYVDANHDCIRDEGEAPLEGVVIQLRDTLGNVLRTTKTNSDGEYHFDELAPGEYIIFEEQPDGYFQGGQVVGSGGGRVLGDDLLTLQLQAGTNVINYDFCELPPSSISGRVWKEKDVNQKFDGGEVPLPGVLVELLNDARAVVSQTRTDSLGLYRFDGLAPGVYAVRETQPSGLFHGGQVVGSAGGDSTVDDLIVGITLVGGTQGVEYNFPEVPPATISGFVFQDGDAITLASAPDPARLREFKDGLLTEDDARIGGVTLELRNVLGQPFTADRTLPGTYPDGPIRVQTDENGFYEFTGLRPGTYHVYQVQPDDYFDGLDVAGSSGGVAVNVADRKDDANEIVIQTLAASELTDPRNDAILNISLAPGDQSVSNNFSEIIVDPLVLIPLVDQPKPVTPRVDTPIENFLNPIRLVSYASPLEFRRTMQADDEWAVSWHLSVINGGLPQSDATVDELVKFANAQQSREAWDSNNRSKGKWTLVDRRGKRLSKSEVMLLGDEDAIAMAGDFDGNGIDEAVLFVAGKWFVDFNGNGHWDEGDLWIRLGTELDRPVVGDWDGDGKDDIGIFGRQWQRDPQRIKDEPGLPDPANMRRRDVSREQLVGTESRGDDRKRLMRRGNEGVLRADAVDHVFSYGEQVDTPITGDWNGDGIDQIAVFRSGQWLLDADGDGRWTDKDTRAEYGELPGDEPIAGDFTGDGIDEIGVIRGDLWIIDTDGDRRLTGNDLRIEVPRESNKSQPVVGDWDGDGKDEPGYYNYGT